MKKDLPLRIIPGLLGAAALALLSITSGLRLLLETPSTGLILLGAGLLWVGIFAAVCARSSKGLIMAATIGLAFYSAIGVAGKAELAAPGDERFYSALSIEGIVLLVTALVVAQIRYFWKQPETAA